MRTSLALMLACLALSACSYTRPVEHPEPLVMDPDYIIAPAVQQQVENKIDREFYSQRLY